MQEPVWLGYAVFSLVASTGRLRSNSVCFSSVVTRVISNVRIIGGHSCMAIVQVSTKELGIYLNALSESFIFYRLKGAPY